MRKLTPEIRSSMRVTVIYFLLSLVCVIVSQQFVTGVAHPVWHDVLLLIGGVLLGGMAAMIVYTNIEINKSSSKKEE